MIIVLLQMQHDRDRMKIALHVGAHATDEDRLLKCLLRNTDDFRKRGISVPGPGRYRKLINSTLNALSRSEPSDQAREVLLDAICNDDPESIDRLILSHENLFSVPKISLAADRFYPRAEERINGLRRLFPDDDLILCLAIRDPATWLPAVYDATPHDDFSNFLNGCDPAYLRWSELIGRIQFANPGVHFIVWCNEDSPLIWGDIIRAMAALPSGRKITGAFDLLSQIMSDEGMKRFRAYLASHPVMTEKQKRRVMMAFLDKYALEDALEQELDVPGWTEEYVDVLSELYDQDVDVIANMSEVTLISP